MEVDFCPVLCIAKCLFYRLSGQSVILSGIIAYRQMNCKWCKFGVKNQRKKESANKMKLTYTNVNGYLIPNLIYKSGNQMEQLGKYGPRLFLCSERK